MTKSISVADTTKGEILQYTGDVRFGYGVNSPYPGDSQAPVPNASFQVAGDSENLYRMDNTARLDYQREGSNFRELSFSGRFATSSDAPVGSMNISHASNELNKDIRSWPILKEDAYDTSNGRKTLVGALRHWYAEAGLNEFGVRGDFLFSTTNSLPTVAYYDHPTMRFTGTHFGTATTNPLIKWERTLPVQADQGASFNVGETVTFIIKANENFGRAADGLVPSQLSEWGSHLDLLAGRPQVVAGGEVVFGLARISVMYRYNSREWVVEERNTNDASVNTEVITDTAISGSPSMVIVQMTRLTDTDVQYHLEFKRPFGNTEYNFVSTSNLLPNSFALSGVWGTLVDNDYASPTLAQEGVQGMYVIKGDQYTVSKEDEWPIAFSWVNRPKLKNIVIPGMKGNAWAMIHNLCAVYGLRFDPVYNNFASFEDIGRYDPWTTPLGSGVAVSASTREMAETVEVVNYNYKASQITGKYTTLYKADSVYSVALGEKIEEIIQLEEGTSFIDINPPVCSNPQFVIDAYNDPDTGYSVYSVYDDDNLVVDSKSWNDGGGFISAEPTENVGEIKLTIQAPNNDLISKSPTFHISIAGADIPGLVISGLGVKSTKETITSRTGAGKTRNLKVLGETYDNPLVCNSNVAWNVASKLAALYGTVRTEATGTFPPSVNFDFPALPLLRKGSFYMPTSVSGSQANIQVSNAVRYNPVEWVQDRYPNMTCGEYDALWVGSTCREVVISPLGKDHF